ncbi:carbohydrate ABC transporter permease [Mucisphaera calidilacus]|uniref:L-arabinose transport system permease protein AraQ n=1 Tax=Mucisphaera calidilacus TaxID=2527982 RepID=A0A518BWZ2_9BACT|nr:carbohydrate ABC transporter permease [Mucisphaera calidilacus]QDU71492.1 L-arabinose transport system permease protein AraQ [Mucisphaera calidilacus]
MASKPSAAGEGVKHLIVLFVLFFAFFPLFLMFVISFKDNQQYQANPWFFDPISEWHWENWSVAWGIVKNYIANSIFVSVQAVAFGICMIIPTAYAIARYRFPGREIVYYGIVASMFLPGTAATLVTLFTLLKGMGLINSLWALVVVGAAGGQVAGIFILRQFIEDIPKALFEAAEMDGAGHIQQIVNIVLPMSGPILATISIMKFLGVWNNVMLPLVILRDDEKLTIPVGLLRLEGEYVKQWGEMMAGYSLSSIPLIIMFIFLMRWFVRGLAAGAIKG